MFYDEGRDYTMDDVANLVQKLRNEWKVSFVLFFFVKMNKNEQSMIDRF